MKLLIKPSDKFVSEQHGKKATDFNVSGEMPIRSGSDSGTGEYFVQLKVGSPAQKFVLIADTGSDLTWMNCKYRCHRNKCTRNLNKKRVFHPERSSSFRTVPCSSRMCKVDLANLFSLVTCPSPKDPCAYDYRYMCFLIHCGQIYLINIVMIIMKQETTSFKHLFCKL